MPHLKAVQLSSWGRSCSLDSYSLPAQLRVSKFCVAENGVYWCSHKTGKNCHFYGDKWWLDPIDRCFFKGTSTVFSDNLNISQFCLLTFLCPGWNSYSLEPWAEVPIAQSFQPRYSWDVEWCQPIHWADLNSVFVRTFHFHDHHSAIPILPYSVSNLRFYFRESKHDRKHLWFLDMLQKGAVKRSARLSYTDAAYHNVPVAFVRLLLVPCQLQVMA